MLTVNCLVADDEPIAREIILNYCTHLPMLTVIASCSNALEAKAVMQSQRVDILFLDINMPVLDGISFLKTVQQYKPQVIFTTAYKEYAVNAFDLSAVDYLLKPFSLERFIVAVDKALERLNKPATPPAAAAQTNDEYLLVKTDSKIYRIAYADIVYAEASGNFTKIVTTQNTLMPTITFSSFQQQLPSSMFCRVHRSFIISKARITHIEGNTVFINRVGIPIGSSYKDAFLKEIGL